jgi:hypothetical protein
MPKYHFVGTYSEIGSGVQQIKLNQFGQAVTLDQKEADNAMSGGCPLVTEQQFTAAAFSAEELKRYRYTGTHLTAPPAFQQKKNSVQAQAAANRADANKRPAADHAKANLPATQPAVKSEPKPPVHPDPAAVATKETK